MQETENDVLEQENGGGNKVYELGYLLVPTISQDDIPIMYGNIKELIVTFGGVIISDEMPKMVPLAYFMTKVLTNVRNKFNTAYFGWIKFSMNAGKVLELKKKIDLDSNFVRFLILKTVKENTIAAKRFIRSDTMRRRGPTIKRGGGNGEVVPINKEEIDKEIDALVAV